MMWEIILVVLVTAYVAVSVILSIIMNRHERAMKEILDSMKRERELYEATHEKVVAMLKEHTNANQA